MEHKIEELTLFERKIISDYENFTNVFYHPEKKHQYDKWIKDGTIEKTWINIYKKLPLEKHIEELLFVPVYNQESVISEMDEYISTILNK